MIGYRFHNPGILQCRVLVTWNSPTTGIVRFMTARLTTAMIAELMRSEWSSLPNGTRLPSDRALADQFDVSHGVIGRIMADMERQGFVRRQPGSGSYWLGNVEAVPTNTPPSFAHAMRKAGLTPGSMLVGHETRRVATTERTLLDLPANSVVWRLQRVLTIEDIPVGFATSVLPARDLRALPAELDSYGSLFETLRRRYLLDPVRMWKRRRPVELPRFVGDALGLRGPVPARLEESVNRACDGPPIEYARTYMRTDALGVDALVGRARSARTGQQEAFRR